MSALDLNKSLWTFTLGGAQILNPNGFMPDAGTIVGPAGNMDGGHLFDVSAWDSWTLMGVLSTTVLTCDLTLVFFDNFSGHNTGAKQIVKLPQNAAQAGVPFMIAGRCLGPIMTAQLQASPAGAIGQLDFMVHNRTRLFDAPYMPGLLGTMLAAIPQQSFTAIQTRTADLPFYLGPAYLSINSGEDTSATELGVAAQVLDDVATPQSIGYVNSNAGVQRLWVPNLRALSSKWTLGALNNSAATQTLGAVLVAG